MVVQDRHNRRLTNAEVVSLRRDYIGGASHADLAAKYGISIKTVPEIVTGRSWKRALALPNAPNQTALDAALNKKPRAKITARDAVEIRRRLALGDTGRSLAIAYGVHYGTISDIKRGLTWRD